MTTYSDAIAAMRALLYTGGKGRIKPENVADVVQGVTDALNASIISSASGEIQLKGDWDASAGTFPGGGTALKGAYYRVSVAGTVDSVAFTVGDGIYARVDNASTTTYAPNWQKAEGLVTSAEVVAALGFTPANAASLGTAASHAATDFDAAGAAATAVATAEAYSIQRSNHTGTQPASTITGLAAVATTGAYSALTGAPSLGTAAAHAATDFDTAGAAAAAQAAAIQRGNHTGTQPASTITGLAAVATTGAYSDLTGKPTLGSAAALTAGTAANNVVQLDSSAKLPAVDGSQITNIPNGSGAFLYTAQSLSAAQQQQAFRNLGLNAYGLRTGFTYFVDAYSPPPGTIKKNGAILSRATYADLWAWVQANAPLVSEATWFANYWGAFSWGDGSTNFRIPENRGEFFRGWDDGRGADSGRGLGQWQAQDVQPHTHPNGAVSAGVLAANGGYYGQATFTNSGANAGTETRPRNIPLLACIAY